jgi:hypothetical protein
MSNSLREALKLCMDELCTRCRELAAARGNPLPCLSGCEPVRKAKAALAEPVRNCEVGSPEEQQERFDEFCVSHYTPPNKDGVVPDGCDCPCYVRGKGCNEFAWAQLPYVEKEGGEE